MALAGQRHPLAAINCASYGSIATTCEGPVDPSLSHEVHAMWAWLYWRTGNSKYLTWAQQSAGTDYGGSGGRTGISPCLLPGPMPRALPATFLAPFRPCGSLPCGGYGTAISLGKDFTASQPARGNANNAMAYMILGAAGTSVTCRR